MDSTWTVEWAGCRRSSSVRPERRNPPQPPNQALAGRTGGGRYWTRTGDPQLVELGVACLRPARNRALSETVEAALPSACPISRGRPAGLSALWGGAEGGLGHHGPGRHRPHPRAPQARRATQSLRTTRAACGLGPQRSEPVTSSTRARAWWGRCVPAARKGGCGGARSTGSPCSGSSRAVSRCVRERAGPAWGRAVGVVTPSEVSCRCGYKPLSVTTDDRSRCVPSSLRGSATRPPRSHGETGPRRSAETRCYGVCEPFGHSNGGERRWRIGSTD